MRAISAIFTALHDPDQKGAGGSSSDRKYSFGDEEHTLSQCDPGQNESVLGDKLISG